MNQSRSQTDDGQLAARRILAVTEEELQRLVLDIHDGPVQQLFAAQSQIRSVQQRRERGEALSETDWAQLLARLSGLLGAALHDIRNFVGTFRPPEFVERDIAEILRGLIMQHETFTGCRVELAVCVDSPPASLPTKIALYRICQEALSNAYRHARTARQWVRLDMDAEGRLVLEIEDRGRGFAPPPLSGPQATEREEHIGLRGMRDRVELVGGQFEIRSAPGAGTRVVVQVPPDI